MIRDPTTGSPTAFEVVYVVVGRGTGALTQRRPGERVAVWGPLGNGFGPPPPGPVDPCRRRHRSNAVPGARSLVAWPCGLRTQIGRAEPAGPYPTVDGQQHQPPDAFSPTITMLYGVRTAALLAGVDDFRHAGIDVELATDDGTAGHHGYVTDLLARSLERGDRPARIVGCGPPAMLATLAKIVRPYDIPCEVSLENQMACGFGACFSCVVPIRQPDGSTDLRRVCVEGPIVAADHVDWSRLVH